MSAFPKRLTAYFLTNRDRRSGGYGGAFENGDPRLIRLGEVTLEKIGGAWVAGGVETYPEHALAASATDSEDGAWELLGSTRSFETLREASLDGRASDILIYLHGAGHSFASVAETTALMVELYSPAGRPICPYFITFPANGSSDPISYFADRDDAELSAIAIARSFGKLVAFLSAHKQGPSCGARMHLFAHSLGAFALRKAVEVIFANPRYRPLRLFDTVFLAHADDDEDTLADPLKMHPLTQLTKRIVIYYDRGDKLLRLSDAVHVDRLGQKGPDPFPGARISGCEIAAVDCSAVAFDLKGDLQRHRHYLRASSVIADIRAVLQRATPVRERLDMEGFWRLA